MIQMRIKSAVAVLLVHVSISAICLAQESTPAWSTLIPLKSTRSEVEKILGKPDQTFDSYALYRNGDGLFSVWYSLGGCGHKIEGLQWNVPKGLMTSLFVRANKTMPMTKYISNIDDYRREEMPYDRILYVSPNEGLIFETIKSKDRDKLVYSVTLDPTKEQDKLRCK